MDTDDSLLAAWQRQRDEAALAELCRRHAGLVRAACCWHGASDPDEAAQAVMIVLARRAGAVRTGALTSFLIGIARRIADRQRRAAARRSRHEREAAMATSATTVPAADDPAWAEARPHLADALASLSPGRREAVVRFYLQGKAQAEVAAELGCSADAVKTRVHEGLQRLRAFFARRGVVLGGAALAAGLAHEAPAAEPALAEACLRAAITPGGPSAALASGVVTAMIIKTTALIAAATITVASLLTVTLMPGEEPAPPPPAVVVADDPGANAALVWYRAFAAMPAEETPIMRLAGRPSLQAAADPVADEAFARGMPALALLARGAEAPYCDWGIEYIEEMSYRHGFRPLVRLACLRACWHVAHGDGDAAVAELMAVMRAARLYPGHRPMLVDVLIGHSCEHIVIGSSGILVQRLAPAQRSRLDDALRKLPMGIRSADTFEKEIAYVQSRIQIIRDIPVRDRLMRWESAAPATPTAEQVSDAGLDQALAMYLREVARWRQLLSAPVSEGIKPMTTYIAGDAAPHPLVEAFAIAVSTLRRSEVKLAVRHAQMLAAIAVLNEGDAALARHPDPVTGRPFQKIAVDGGFVLTADVPGFKPGEISFRVGAAAAVVPEAEPATQSDF